MRNLGPFLWVQRGVSVLTAVFVMLLLGVISALMVNLMSTAHMTSVLDVEGSRAYQAAQAGVEWGLYQVLDPGLATVNAMVPPYGTGAQPFPNLPGCFTPNPTTLPTIDGFTVIVSCVPNDYTEGDRSIRVYRLTATASKGTLGMPNFIERQVAVTASKCRSKSGTAPTYECP